MIPKILRIEKLKDFNILCCFNTGQKFGINFLEYFKMNPDNTIYNKLKSKEIFDTIDCNGRTVFWPKMASQIVQNGDIIESDYEIDPVMLYDFASKSAFQMV